MAARSASLYCDIATNPLDVSNYSFGMKLSVYLNGSANRFYNAVTQKNFDLHFFDQVVARFDSKDTVDLPLLHFLVEFQQLNLLKLLQDLVLLLQKLAFLFIHLNLNAVDLLKRFGTRRLEALLLNFSNHALPLHFKLLELVVELIKLRL